MKKIIIALVAVFALSSFVYAAPKYPMDEGSQMMAGSASFTSQSGDIVGDDTLTTMQLHVSYGYFIIPNLAIAGELGMINSSLDDADVSSSSLSIGPAIYYYITDGSSNLHPFVFASPKTAGIVPAPL